VKHIFVTPDEPGSYRGVYKLQTSEEEEFGPEFVIDIEVFDPQSAAPESKEFEAEFEVISQENGSDSPKIPEVAGESEAPAAEAPVYKYQRELDQIHKIGFNNDVLAKLLLGQSDGDIHKVLNALIQLQ